MPYVPPSVQFVKDYMATLGIRRSQIRYRTISERKTVRYPEGTVRRVSEPVKTFCVPARETWETIVMNVDGVLYAGIDVDTIVAERCGHVVHLTVERSAGEHGRHSVATVPGECSHCASLPTEERVAKALVKADRMVREQIRQSRGSRVVRYEVTDTPERGSVVHAVAQISGIGEEWVMVGEHLSADVARRVAESLAMVDGVRVDRVTFSATHELTLYGREDDAELVRVISLDVQTEDGWPVGTGIVQDSNGTVRHVVFGPFDYSSITPLPGEETGPAGEGVKITIIQELHHALGDRGGDVVLSQEVSVLTADDVYDAQEMVGEIVPDGRGGWSYALGSVADAVAYILGCRLLTDRVSPDVFMRRGGGRSDGERQGEYYMTWARLEGFTAEQLAAIGKALG